MKKLNTSGTNLLEVKLIELLGQKQKLPKLLNNWRKLKFLVNFEYKCNFLKFILILVVKVYCSSFVRLWITSCFGFYVH